jgi:hypothetical protein
MAHPAFCDGGPWWIENNRRNSGRLAENRILIGVDQGSSAVQVDCFKVFV